MGELSLPSYSTVALAAYFLLGLGELIKKKEVLRKTVFGKPANLLMCY